MPFNRHPEESDNDCISRAMHELDKNKYPDQKQRVAIAYSMCGVKKMICDKCGKMQKGFVSMIGARSLESVLKEKIKRKTLDVFKSTKYLRLIPLSGKDAGFIGEIDIQKFMLIKQNEIANEFKKKLKELTGGKYIWVLDQYNTNNYGIKFKFHSGKHRRGF